MRNGYRWYSYPISGYLSPAAFWLLLPPPIDTLRARSLARSLRWTSSLHHGLEGAQQRANQGGSHRDDRWQLIGWQVSARSAARQLVPSLEPLPSEHATLWRRRILACAKDWWKRPRVHPQSAARVGVLRSRSMWGVPWQLPPPLAGGQPIRPAVGPPRERFSHPKHTLRHCVSSGTNHSDTRPVDGCRASLALRAAERASTRTRVQNRTCDYVKASGW